MLGVASWRSFIAVKFSGWLNSKIQPKCRCIAPLSFTSYPPPLPRLNSLKISSKHSSKLFYLPQYVQFTIDFSNRQLTKLYYSPSESERNHPQFFLSGISATYQACPTLPSLELCGVSQRSECGSSWNSCFVSIMLNFLLVLTLTPCTAHYLVCSSALRSRIYWSSRYYFNSTITQ